MNQVSVMIPVFNMEKHINKCIDSVLAQTYDNLSIILVNDGSHDSSGEICEEYKEKDSRITVIHQENSGQSVARNRAIEIAEDINPDGYLIGLDSDDWLEPNYLMELVLLMEESQLDCAIGNGRRVSIDKTDNIIGIEDRILFNKDFVTDNLEDIYKIQANACAARVNDFNGEWSITALRSVATPWDKLFRISLIKENHLIFVEDMRSREDIIFSLYYLHLCKKVGYKKSILTSNKICQK